MKAQSTGNTFKNGLPEQAGFITVEILIAFTILILCMGGVIILSFGNQSLAVDSETSIEAVAKAKALLEKARADSRFDFNAVNLSIETETSGPIVFTKKLDVRQTDLFTKEVSSTISWQTGGRNLSTVLTTLLVHLDGAKGGDTCSSVLAGDWKNPEIESTFKFSTITPPGTYTLTDIDAYNGIVYVTAGKTTAITDPALFIFDVHDPGNIQLLGKIDNDPLSTVGMNSITAANQYAYAANASRPATTGQLQTFNVSNSAPPALVKSFPLTGNSAGGNSIFYVDGYIYLGTKSSATGEFNIIDVHNPSAYIRHGVYMVGNDINAIIVRDNYAYIASPNAEELQVLDISDPAHVVKAGGFNSATGGGNGKSVYIVGDKIYVGKTTGSGFDFHILDNTDPAHITELGGRDVASSVNSLIARDYLSFLLTGTPTSGVKLQILRTDDPGNITPWNSALSLSSTSNATEPSMDCEGNRLYITANDAAGQGTIYIIKPKI